MLGSNRRSHSHSQDEAVPMPDSAAIPVAAAVPVAAPARQGGGRLALPVLGGLCCLGLILLSIAAIIILSLIPLYPSPKDATRTVEEVPLQIDAPVDNAQINSAGDLNAAQTRALQSELQNRVNSDPAGVEATVVVNSAQAVASGSTGKRKRQTGATIVRIVLRVFFRRPVRRRQRILFLLISFRISSSLAAQLNSLATPTTTAASATTTTSSAAGNNTRRLVRRSLEEGGAPAGLVYVDSHQVAAMKGNVSAVSFYIDRTCGLAKVEFGAFELLKRDVHKNTAELRLVKRSGALTLPKADKLKPIMTMITIELCGKNSDHTCQGHQFPILPHQYIGIRSDSCRLGFAPPAANFAERTTWKVAGGSDPFEQVYDELHYVPADYTVLHSVSIAASDSSNSESVIEQHAGTQSGPRILFVGSYPPRQCGLAKFLEDLTDAYQGPHSVVAVDENTEQARARTYPEKVIYRLNQEDRESYYKLADLVNSQAFDVLSIQHEYALYGGMIGEYLLAMLGAVRKPVILTMHTVLPKPNTMFMSVTRALCATSTRVIVMTELGRRLLIEVYGVDETKIVVVPHGVPDVPFVESTRSAKEKLGFNPEVPTMTTFGLLSRNKNIEFALKGLQRAVQAVPNLKYYIIGETHPVIVSHEGESYRHGLEANVTALGLTKNVVFIDKYVSDSELLNYLAATDIYLTPYAQEDQYVSGTLSWAVGVGKAVISTPYMYAKEILADGRGFLVSFNDDEALGTMIIQLVEDDKLRNAARRRAYQHGRSMTWSFVANQVETIARKLLIH